MKKSYLIILVVLIFLTIWAISPLGIAAIFNPQKINLTQEITQEIQSEISEKNIIKPIQQNTLIIYKKEQLAEVWIKDKNNQMHLTFFDTISLKNNQNGTRLYDNESIVPEGIYQIKKVNSDKLNFIINFPNAFDAAKQKADKRPKLTSEITFGIKENDIKLSKKLMTEFLFLAREATVENTRILIFPSDFKKNTFPQNCLTCPFWIEELYGSLRAYSDEFQ